jgi:diacylglycerol kinase (ATP)
MRRVRVVLCANTASGSGATSAEEVAELLRCHGAEVEARGIEELGDPARAVDPAVARGVVGDAARVVVAGGDGSIGLAASAAAVVGVPLAVVPTGTANDFARALGLPLDVEEASALAADADATVRPLDLAQADERPFVNAASAGLAPVAAREAKPYKKVLGPLAYAVGALKAGVTASPLRCTVVVDGEERFAGEAWQLVVGNTGHFGGGSSTGAADAGDGALDVAVVEAGSRVALVRRAWGMRAGRLVRQDGVLHARGGEVVVDAGDAPFNVDGELCRCGPPARFRVRPRAVRVVVPS